MLARIYGSAARLVTGGRRISFPNASIDLRLDAESQQRTMQDTAFADGLRGIAATYVVSSHLVLCYATYLMNPCCGPDSDQPTLMQRPIFRLVAAGHSWVAMFFILLGFVNSLKPLSLARSGQTDAAASKLAASSLSRIFRLLFPTSMATIISWLICQLGIYEMGRNSEAFWLRANTPTPSSNIFAALGDLKDGLLNTWSFEFYNQYDQPQWAIVYLLQGSLMTILALLITANMTTLWRILFLVMAALSTASWSRKASDPYVGLACFLGITLAEFSLSSAAGHLSSVSPYISPPIAIFALVLMSHPGDNPEAAPWSASLQHFGEITFGDYSIHRLYGTIGGVLLLASIIISPHARHALSRPPLRWLGKISFAIYLLHGTILRSLFAWMLFCGSEMQEFQDMEQPSGWPEGFLVPHMRYPLPSTLRCVVATVVSLAAILFVSHLWNLKIEPWCASLTGLVEKLVKGDLSTREALEVVSVSRTPEEKEVTLLPVVRQD